MATDGHSECVLLVAFVRKQLLLQHTSILRLYVHCLPCLIHSSLKREITRLAPRCLHRVFCDQ
jgi:hypothetical protein